MKSVKDIKARIKKLQALADHPNTPKHESDACTKKIAQLKASLPVTTATNTRKRQKPPRIKTSRGYYTDEQLHAAETAINAYIRVANANMDAQISEAEADIERQLREYEQRYTKNYVAYYAQYGREYTKKVAAMHAKHVRKQDKIVKFTRNLSIALVVLIVTVFVLRIFL